MIKILLFAGLKERVGKDYLEWERVPIKVKDLREALKDIQGFGNIESVMIAINESYAAEEALIMDGDTVALIPPVSGG